jgi:hypothetical protein
MMDNTQAQINVTDAEIGQPPDVSAFDTSLVNDTSNKIPIAAPVAVGVAAGYSAGVMSNSMPPSMINPQPYQPQTNVKPVNPVQPNGMHPVPMPSTGMS